MQLEAIASRPIASYLGVETNTCLITTSFQVVVESNKVPPQPSLLCDGLREATRAGKGICSLMSSGSLQRSKHTASCKTGRRGNPSEA